MSPKLPMEFPEPFHSAKTSSWPSLMRNCQVSPYAKSAVRRLLASSRDLRAARRADRLALSRARKLLKP
jgi:hypothetical protein